MVEDVYAELHRIAEGYVRHERAKSVQATDLVPEAYWARATRPYAGRSSISSRLPPPARLWSAARARAAARRAGSRHE
jgi:hypothetical protein